MLHISLAQPHNALVPSRGNSIKGGRLARLLLLGKQDFLTSFKLNPKGSHLLWHTYSFCLKSLDCLWHSRGRRNEKEEESSAQHQHMQNTHRHHGMNTSTKRMPLFPNQPKAQLSNREDLEKPIFHSATLINSAHIISVWRPFLETILSNN